MQPKGYRICYRDSSGALTTIEREGFSSFACSDFSLDVSWDDELLTASLAVAAPCDIESFDLVVSHDFSRDGILMNGYQSWTDTRELSSLSTMTGLAFAPKGVVERYVLDGGGDYRFVDYDGRPGYFHGFTYAVFSRFDDTLLIGSLDESQGFTILRTDPRDKTVTICPECPAKTLQAGEERLLGRWAIVQTSGSNAKKRAYDRWFELADMKARFVRPLVGYTSWYRHYDDIDEAKLLLDLSGMIDAFSRDDVAKVCREIDAVRLFQVDDGWCTVGDWLRPHEDRFPEGMAAVARDISIAGFAPGLWMAPFVCSKESKLFAEHPDWLLRSVEAGESYGKPIMTGSHWEGAFALDALNPGVREYAATCIRTAVAEWGFRLLKLDFLYAACMEPHGGMNRGELMADAFDLVREAAGDAMILACGVPLGSVFGKTEYCRVGCDVGLDWDDAPHMRLLHRERVSTKWSLIDAQARAPLNGRVFGNDPDVVFFRDDVRLTRGQRSEMYDTAATCGSVLLTSDDMAQWTPAQMARFTDILRAIGGRMHA